jgi:hypothetical protein
MITPKLHLQPLALDSQRHRQAMVQLPITDWSHLAGLNALFLTAAECVQAAGEFPIVFIRAGVDAEGKPEFAPIAVFGLATDENLYLEGGQWRATHMPAVMAVYPFGIARAGAGDKLAVCIDSASAAVSSTGTGQRLFTDGGEPTDFARQVIGELERLEAQVQGTRQIVRRLLALDLLREKRLDATLPDGQKLGLDGFFTVDEERVKALPDATVLDLHRDGLLAFIHAHWVSLTQMRRLLQRRAERVAARSRVDPR